jgi:hypothetical protein
LRVKSEEVGMRKIFLVFAVVFLGGCSTLVQKSGEFLDGGRGKTLELYRSTEKDKKTRTEVRRVLAGGEEFLEIENAALPGFRLRATLPLEDGVIEFTSLEFLSSHPFGWNEFTLELFGEGSFTAAGNTALLRIEEAPERVQLTAGRISLKESRLAADEALRSLRNRRERILALTEWMKGQDGLPAFAGQGAFEAYWKGRLFPELVSKKERPPEWSAAGNDFVRADSVNWNRDYTRRVFPEGLWEYRDSAALLRDWEEGAAWIYLEYAWDSIFASFEEIKFEK